MKDAQLIGGVYLSLFAATGGARTFLEGFAGSRDLR
jgi:hypothetical protein